MLTDAEKGFIINYILINNNWLRIKSRGLYQELERTPQLSHHRWQNMRAFMVFTLKNEIRTNPMYGALNEDDKDKLLNGSKSKAAANLTGTDRVLVMKNEQKSSYTEQDDIDIINYMLQDEHYTNIKKACEQIAATVFADTSKTASSIRERFMRRIRMKLHTYAHLNEAQRSVLRGPARTSPPPPSSENNAVKTEDGQQPKVNRRRRKKPTEMMPPPNNNNKRTKVDQNDRSSNRLMRNTQHQQQQSSSSGGRTRAGKQSEQSFNAVQQQQQNRSRRKPTTQSSTAPVLPVPAVNTRNSQAAIAASQQQQQQQQVIAATIAARTRYATSHHHHQHNPPTQAPVDMASLLNANSSALWLHNPPSSSVAAMYDSNSYEQHF